MCNGWSSYETWRVNLEMLDGYDPSDFLADFDLADGDRDEAVERLAESLEEMVTEIVSTDVRDDQSFAYSVVMSFLARVDWTEIAEHMVDDYIAELV